MNFRRFILLFAAVCISLISNANEWAPEHDVTLIVSYKQGNGTDVGARILATSAEKFQKHKFIVKNISGNDGIDGWNTLIASKADGYTLGFINLPTFATMALSPYAKFSFNDIVPICNQLTETSVVVVRDDSPYQTIQDLVKDAKENGNLLASTNGFMASNHTAAQLFSTSAGFKYIAVDCGGTADQIQALVNDEVQFTCVKVPDVKAYEKLHNKTLRVLASFSEKRLDEYPNVPTLGECGYYDKWYGSSRGIIAPKGTPHEIIRYYSTLFEKIMSDPEVIDAHKKANLLLDYKDNLNFEAVITASAFFAKDIIPMIYKNESSFND